MNMQLLRLYFIIFVVIRFETIGYCQPEQQQGHVQPTFAEQHSYQRCETITYDWKDNGVKVSFCRQDTNLVWTMAVHDAQGILCQAFSAGGEKIWAVSDAKCSLSECLEIIDRSLTAFHAEKPSAKLESIDVEMDIVRDLWISLMNDLGKRLSILPGEKGAGRFDVPDEIEDTIQQTVENSSTSEAIKQLARKHGMNVKSIAEAEHIMFRDSLTGRKWSDIARLPGIGILAPGTVEYVIHE